MSALDAVIARAHPEISTLVPGGNVKKAADLASNFFTAVALFFACVSPYFATKAAVHLGIVLAWGCALFIPVAILALAIFIPEFVPETDFSYGHQHPSFPIGMENANQSCFIIVALQVLFHSGLELEGPIEALRQRYLEAQNTGETLTAKEVATSGIANDGNGGDPLDILGNYEGLKTDPEEGCDLRSFIVFNDGHYWMGLRDDSGYWWALNDHRRVTMPREAAMEYLPVARKAFYGPSGAGSDTDSTGRPRDVEA